MWPIQQLERATTETWIGIGIGLFTVIVPMTWTRELVLLGIMYALACDLAWRSGWTFRLWIPAKVAMCFVALALLLAAAGDSVAGRYFEKSSARVPVPWPIKAIDFGDYYASQPRVILGLIAVLTLTILWRIAPIARLRHLSVFVLRRAVMEQVWISREKALRLVEESAWASTRRGTSPWLSANMLNNILSGKDAMFQRWCAQVLDFYKSSQERSVRVVDSKMEFEENALRAYLLGKYDAEVKKAFGNPY